MTLVSSVFAGPARFRNKTAKDETTTAKSAAVAAPHKIIDEPIHPIEAASEDVDDSPRESVGQMGINAKPSVSAPVGIPTAAAKLPVVGNQISKSIRVIRSESLAKKPKTEPTLYVPIEESSNYQCPVCRKDFPSAFRLECHQNYCKMPNETRQHPKFRCEECGMIFMWESALFTHRRVCHERPFVVGTSEHKCTRPGCSSTFDTALERDLHLLKHGNAEEYTLQAQSHWIVPSEPTFNN